jgi:hypothetical protein
MLTIVHLYTVPDEQINAGITKGVVNPQKADEILRKFFL